MAARPGARRACQGRAAPSRARAALHTRKRSRRLREIERPVVDHQFGLGVAEVVHAVAKAITKCLDHRERLIRSVVACRSELRIDIAEAPIEIRPGRARPSANRGSESCRSFRSSCTSRPGERSHRASTRKTPNRQRPSPSAFRRLVRTSRHPLGTQTGRASLGGTAFLAVAGCSATPSVACGRSPY